MKRAISADRHQKLKPRKQKSSKRQRRAAPYVMGVGASLALSAVGISVGIVISSPVTPATLASAATVTDAPVSTRDFVDRRSVELTLELTADAIIESPRAGRVTRSQCAPGSTLTSGTSAFWLDGSPLLNLATETPLWRDLEGGDLGDDVAALQKELARLGKEVELTGRLDRATLSAYTQLARGPEADRLWTITANEVLWLPAPEVKVAQCPATTGSTVTAGDPLVNLPEGLAGAHVTLVPADAAAGPRVVKVEELALPVTETGEVTDAASLAQLAQTRSFTAAKRADGEATLGAYLELAIPTTVAVVPPASLYDIKGNQACVVASREARAVTIIASELGQSLVTFEKGDVPRTVSLAPASTSPKSVPCR